MSDMNVDLRGVRGVSVPGSSRETWDEACSALAGWVSISYQPCDFHVLAMRPEGGAQVSLRPPFFLLPVDPKG